MIENKENGLQGLIDLAKANLRNYSMFIMLVLILIGFGIATGGDTFIPRNFTFIFIQNSYILVLAVGMVLVIIIGNIDLSVGSVVAFTGAISAIIYNRLQLPFYLTLLLTILAGLLIGAYQAYWIAYAKIPAFIVTLSGMMMFRGLTYYITNVTPITPRTDMFKDAASGAVDFLRISKVSYNSSNWIEGGGKEMYHRFSVSGDLNLPDMLNAKVEALHILPLILGVLIILYMIFSGLRDRRNKINNGFHTLPMNAFIIKLVFLSSILMYLCVQFARYRGLPTVVAILGVTVLIFTFITNNTVFGRYIYAVGGNARSAKLSGINSERVVFFVHTIMGGLCGLAGVIFTGYMNSALPDAGDMFELEAIAACFIGGASASGGIGTIIGAIMGGLVMGSINNGLSLLNVGANGQYVVKATVLLLAVWYDIYNRKKSGLA